MKAILIERYGPPEVLVECEFPSPQPGPDEIKLHVMASGVNFADILQRLNLYGRTPRVPYVPGFEVAGEVVSVGTGVKGVKPGQRLAALTRFGGYAEEVCIPERATRPIPPSLTFPQAAAIPVNYLTAWFCLFAMGHLHRKDRVLIQGGGRWRGYGGCAVGTSTPEPRSLPQPGRRKRLVFLAGLGVDHPINYHAADFVEVVRKHTGGQGVDLVLDAVGGDVLRRGFELLAPFGRLITYGLSAAAPSKRKNWLRISGALWKTPNFKALNLIRRNVGVFGFHLGLLVEGTGKTEIAQAFQSILELVQSGTI